VLFYVIASVVICNGKTSGIPSFHSNYDFLMKKDNLIQVFSLDR